MEKPSCFTTRPLFHHTLSLPFCLSSYPLHARNRADVPNSTQKLVLRRRFIACAAMPSPPYNSSTYTDTPQCGCLLSLVALIHQKSKTHHQPLSSLCRDEHLCLHCAWLTGQDTRFCCCQLVPAGPTVGFSSKWPAWELQAGTARAAN
jgi:hypothetical protein